jgi:hypothetical protein
VGRYVYAVKHLYGAEGGGRSYRSLACGTMIRCAQELGGGPARKGRCHGCPFPLAGGAGDELLALTPDDARPAVRAGMADLLHAAATHPQRACRLYFALTHGDGAIPEAEVFVYPRDFYVRSVACCADASDRAVATE